MIAINAWNEWPEGSYLEPDKKFGLGYLEAVRTSLARHIPVSAQPSGRLEIWGAGIFHQSGFPLSAFTFLILKTRPAIAERG
jgi:hypothetical protein